MFRKMLHNIVHSNDAEHIQKIADVCCINLTEFKEQYSEEILFALLKK